MNTKIIAHRGDREHFPENTLSSFQSAIKRGVDGIELDIHQSRDGALVVHHDYYLGTTNNGKGLINEQNSDYLKSLDAGSWFSNDFSNEKIPFLEEVFKAFQKSVRYEIELKGYTKDFLEAVFNLIREFDVLSQIEFTSPHVYVLSQLKIMEPAAKTGFFVQQYPSWMTADLGQAMTVGNLELGRINVVHCPLSLLTDNFITQLHQNDIEVHAANCDTEEDLKKAFLLNVDQISTNKVDLALEMKELFVNP